MERTCQLMSEGLGCSISQGTLSNWVRQASEGLEATMEKIKHGLIASPLLHSDETGIHINQILNESLHRLYTFPDFFAMAPEAGPCGHERDRHFTRVSWAPHARPFEQL
jgi:hypothetical protein